MMNLFRAARERKRKLVFVITNNRHHVEVVLPLIAALRDDFELSLLSFCEFRGFSTPTKKMRQIGVGVRCVPPFKVRREPSSADNVKRLLNSKMHGFLRKILWFVLLKPFSWIKSADLVLLLNDSAFPGDFLCDDLRNRRIPFLLLQEGIRFPVPVELGSEYGHGGAAAIACWGAASAHYFRAQGIPSEVLHVTGSPRYDAVVRKDWGAQSILLKQSGALPKAYLLFVSNPIDDLGYCSSETKLEAFREFVIGALPLLRAKELVLGVKLHGRESEMAYQSAIDDLSYGKDVVFVRDGDFHPALAGAAGVVIWASTVGLEAILHGISLGQLEVPGHGFPFEYVSSGAAVALSPRTDLAQQIGLLLDKDEVRSSNADRFLENHLAALGTSTSEVAKLVRSFFDCHTELPLAEN